MCQNKIYFVMVFAIAKTHAKKHFLIIFSPSP